MPEKLRNRVRFYSNFDEVTIIERNHFPEDCGGDLKLEDLIGKFIKLPCEIFSFLSNQLQILFPDPWRKLLESKKDFFLNYNNMKVNRNLYPASVINCDVNTLSNPLETMIIRNVN